MVTAAEVEWDGFSCYSCGAAPTGTYRDGSPRFDHIHPPGEEIVRVDRSGHGPDDEFERIVVALTPDEAEEARACGKLRFDRAQRRKAQDHFGTPSLDSHVLGAGGERAFSKWLRIPWECTTGRYGGASDVAGCQIRAVSRTSLMLKVRDSDPLRIPVVSIVGHGDRFWIRGWCFARDARRDEWYDDPGDRGAPAWFVPNRELRPMATFLLSDGVRAAMGLPPMAAAE